MNKDQVLLCNLKLVNKTYAKGWYFFLSVSLKHLVKQSLRD